MTIEQKYNIAHVLKELSEKSSQGKLALKADVSPATISQMINNKWELIKDEMWRKVMVSLRIDDTWQTAETKNYKLLIRLMSDMQNEGLCKGVSYNAGAGKSHAYKDYERQNANVTYLQCATFWTRKYYMQALCRAAGLDDKGGIVQLVERFVNYQNGLPKALIIIDQFDKLNDASLDLFMDFYNEMPHVSMLVSGVPALEKRIRKGCQHNKSGYREFYSRIGKKWFMLDDIVEMDVRLICEANGIIDDVEFVNMTYNTAEGDLRVVRSEIDKYFLKQKRKRA